MEDIVTHVLDQILQDAVLEGERRKDNLAIVTSIVDQVVANAVSKSEEKKEEAAEVAPQILDLILARAFSDVGLIEETLRKNIKQEICEENG